MDAKTFQTIEVASCLTGIALGDIKGGYSKMQEVASVLFGADIWTHELVHEPTVDAYREEGYLQFPDMPTKAEAEADWQAAGAKAVAAYGPTVTVQPGKHGRREGPVKTLEALVPADRIVVVG
jgi:hypothetical protein